MNSKDVQNSVLNTDEAKIIKLAHRFMCILSKGQRGKEGWEI